MPLVPLRASGEKESGSGNTLEQLFAFGPQINGLPSILEVKIEQDINYIAFVESSYIELKTTRIK